MIDRELHNLADQVIDKLYGKVIIHRYNAYSTNSIYLKFDYGVANSLRISDHPGKQHLKYRFNLMNDQANTPKYTIINENFPMCFYPPEDIDQMIADILQAKEEKIRRYTSYDAVVNKAKQDSQYATKGFWVGAREVKERRP